MAVSDQDQELFYQDVLVNKSSDEDEAAVDGVTRAFMCVKPEWELVQIEQLDYHSGRRHFIVLNVDTLEEIIRRFRERYGRGDPGGVPKTG